MILLLLYGVALTSQSSSSLSQPQGGAISNLAPENIDTFSESLMEEINTYTFHCSWHAANLKANNPEWELHKSRYEASQKEIENLSEGFMTKEVVAAMCDYIQAVIWRAYSRNVSNEFFTHESWEERAESNFKSTRYPSSKMMKELKEFAFNHAWTALNIRINDKPEDAKQNLQNAERSRKQLSSRLFENDDRDHPPEICEVSEAEEKVKLFCEGVLEDGNRYISHWFGNLFSTSLAMLGTILTRQTRHVGTAFILKSMRIDDIRFKDGVKFKKASTAIEEFVCKRSKDRGMNTFRARLSPGNYVREWHVVMFEAAMFLYTLQREHGGPHKQHNNAIRRGRDFDQFNGSLCWIMASFYILAVLQPSRNPRESGEFYRGLSRIDPVLLKKLSEVGYEFEFPGLTSTTRDIKIARGFQQNDPDCEEGSPAPESVLFTIVFNGEISPITGPYFVHLSDFSYYGKDAKFPRRDEQETLFGPFQRFRVLNFKEEDSNKQIGQATITLACLGNLHCKNEDCVRSCAQVARQVARKHFGIDE